jgi:hypothetical protein
MRTKTLLLTAALGVAGITSSFAQVYSQNAVGYVSLPFRVGLTLFCNPLNNTASNSISNLLQNVPLGSNLYSWNGTGFDIATFVGVWDNPQIALPPGVGAFLLTDTAFTNTFVGEVMQGNLVENIPAGLSIKSSKVPQAGAVDVLGLTSLSAGDNLYKWTGTDYTIYTYLAGPWDPSTPTLDVGEAVFIAASTATTWNRTFSVNP